MINTSTKKKRKKTVIHFTSIDELVSLRQAKDINNLIDDSLTIGQKLADGLASFAGSWSFIIFFGLLVSGWVAVNVIQLSFGTFDPYPFILLNLILSMTAALQAPIIMMSQNRQEDKDRIRSDQDYHVNLKTEILIEEILLRLDGLEEQNNRLLKHLKKDEAIIKSINENTFIKMKE